MKGINQLFNQFNIAQFLVQVRQELAKVEWPKKDEFVGSTLITFLFIIVFMIYLGVVDQSIEFIVRKIFLYSI
jgi:preprotein translocase subunit SecE